MTWTSGPAPIVVGVDGSPSSDRAVDWATDEASRRNLPLHLLNAWNVDFSAELIGPLLPGFERESSDTMRAAADRVRALDPDVRVVRRSERTGAAAALVIASLRADTVVVGSRGLSTMGRLLAGSTSMQVAAHAHCPTVVVGESHATRAGRPRVVVGIDTSPASLDAVAYAVTQAAERGGDLTVVHAWDVGLVEGTLALNAPMEVWERFGAEREAMTAEAVAGWSERYPDVHVETRVVHGRAADALVDAASDAELLVVGSRGHGGFLGLLLGSVSRTVLQTAPCPVAVVRPNPGRTVG
jgi:nucleotide-binding universal stress UspA family protein